MIKKTETGYVMDEVLALTLTKYSLDESERLVLRVSPDMSIRQTCGSCGLNERPDIFSVRAFPPAGLNGRRGIWICDECAKKWAPELYADLLKKIAEGYKEWAKDDPAVAAILARKKDAEEPQGLGQEEET